MSDRSYASEDPLAFDARRAPRGGPAPVTLIVSVLLLAVVGGGVFMMYRGGSRGANDAPHPAGQPLSDVRTVAPPQAAPADPASGLSIYKTDPNAAPAAPTFAPPPEQPAPRPDAAPMAQTAANPAPAPVTITAPPAAAPAPVQAASVTTPAVHAAPAAAIATGAVVATAAVAVAHHKADQTAAKHTDAKPVTVIKAASAKPTAAKTVAKKPAAKPLTIDKLLADSAAKPAHKGDKAAKIAADKTQADKTKAAKAKLADKTKAADKSGPATIQLGAFSSQALAAKTWSKAAGAAHGGKGKHIAPVKRADGTTFYNASIGGFASHKDAEAACKRIIASGQRCVVK